MFYILCLDENQIHESRYWYIFNLRCPKYNKTKDLCRIRILSTELQFLKLFFSSLHSEFGIILFTFSIFSMSQNQILLFYCWVSKTSYLTSFWQLFQWSDMLKTESRYISVGEIMPQFTEVILLCWLLSATCMFYRFFFWTYGVFILHYRVCIVIIFAVIENVIILHL